MSHKDFSILELVAKHGVDNVFAWIRPRDDVNASLYSITQHRDVLTDNYKIEFYPLDRSSAIHPERFYIGDFDNMVTHGSIKIFISA
jgi:hypothetical protein